jgi:hypothetical protein
MIEADDHAAPDVDAVLLHPVHALKQRACAWSYILVLFGFAEGLLVGRFDAKSLLVNSERPASDRVGPRGATDISSGENKGN